MKSEKIREGTSSTLFSLSSAKNLLRRILSLNIDGNDTAENDAVAVANCFADYLANVALDIGGQRVHDFLEEDHQYHSSIEK